MNWGQIFQLLLPIIIRFLESIARMPPQAQQEFGNALAQSFTLDESQFQQDQQQPPQQ